MSSSMRILAATAFVAAGIASFAGAAAAMPFADGLALKNAAPATIESVRWGGRGFGFGRGRFGFGGDLSPAPYWAVR